MSKTAFEKIMKGLTEARSFAQGKPVKGLKHHARSIARNEVVAVRLNVGLTQAQFAELVGASIGTVRKWETGERSPSGAAARLLHLLAVKPKVVTATLGIKPQMTKRTPRSGLVAAE
jgi:putative transcriptional regulator